MFLQFMNIFNASLMKHREAMLYKPVLELAESLLGNKTIGVEVSDGKGTVPKEYYTIRFNGGTFDVVSHEREETKLEWEFHESYLHSVVENASEYVDHPEKFEWDWLKSYLGLTE